MKRRVLVVGGGVAGLTTAHELSRTAALRDAWQVEVVEMGHKVGGRLASGHRPERWDRNEEHGLHVWFGWYDNTFRLVDEIWRDWARPPDCPWQSAWDGLRPVWICDHGIQGPEGLEIRRVHHARNCDAPGRATHRSLGGHATTAFDTLRALVRTWQGLVASHAATNPTPGRWGRLVWPHPTATPRWAAAAQRLGKRLEPWLDRLHVAWPHLSGEQRVAAGHRIERVVRRVHGPIVRPLLALCRNNAGYRELAYVLDLTLSVLRGITSREHRILEDGDLDRVSEWELAEWLSHHGAHTQALAHSRLFETVYDMPFAYVEGDRTQRSLEAGTALRFIYRLFAGYKHAAAYLLDAGAGEMLIAPLYELVRARGVCFRPFHRLLRLELDDAGTRVERLVFVRCARARGDYDPLITRNGMREFRCDPDWAQLEDGAALKARGVDFYSRFGDQGETDEVVLQRGRDFDDVVLALPLGSIKADGDGHSPVHAWLQAYPPARVCLERLHLVPTVAAQLWLDPSAAEAGVQGRAVAGWAAPYSVVCDMTPVVDYESWPSPRPGACIYMCGAWPLSSPTAPSTQTAVRKADDAEAQRSLRAQLQHHGSSLLRPGATLYTPPGATSEWTAQYVRANVEPWDLADLALPGADKVRLEANDTGLVNMVLAGSWVRTPVNSTSVEAAVCSGIAAARALGVATRPIFAESLFRTPSTTPHLDRERGVPIVDAQPPSSIEHHDDRPGPSTSPRDLQRRRPTRVAG